MYKGITVLISPSVS